jgi:hypothetical protein
MSEDNPGDGAVINETGEFQEGWTKILPEDIREDATLGNIKGLPDMAKMLVHDCRIWRKCWYTLRAWWEETK